MAGRRCSLPSWVPGYVGVTAAGCLLPTSLTYLWHATPSSSEPPLLPASGPPCFSLCLLPLLRPAHAAPQPSPQLCSEPRQQPRESPGVSLLQCAARLRACRFSDCWVVVENLGFVTADLVFWNPVAFSSRRKLASVSLEPTPVPVVFP